MTDHDNDNDNNDNTGRDALLELAEAALDVVAEEHKDHDCGSSEIALRMSAGIRLRREALANSSGPAQVATNQYRRNYDAIFMSKGGDA